MRAAGVEETVGGAVALGRAANYARVNDFMAVWQNPANLAGSARHLGLDVRLPIFNGCFDRERNNTTADLDQNGTPGIQYGREESFAKVCNKADPFPYGNGGGVIPLWRSLTLGAGIYTPSGIVRLKFGNDRVITQPAGLETLPVTTTGTESANRFLLINREIYAVFAMIALGFSPVDHVRLGASFGWGWVDINYKNIGSVQPGFTDIEIVNDVHVRDEFFPRVTVSVAATPVDAVDVMASFTYTGDISADGYVDLTANGIQSAPRRDCRSAQPGPHCRVKGVTLKIPYQRAEVVLGVRYAWRHRIEQTRDPLHDERWDVELNGFWSATGNVEDYVLKLYDASSTATPPQISFSSGAGALTVPLPSTATLPHRWKDSYGLRLGGDYNVLADKLALRAGVSYESAAVPTNNMGLDYWPVQRVGLHLGLTWRIVRALDLHVAYAHLFDETVNVPVGRGNINEVTAIQGLTKLGVNEGRFTSRLDVVSFQGNWRF